jgi:hypothetical protein
MRTAKNTQTLAVKQGELLAKTPDNSEFLAA